MRDEVSGHIKRGKLHAEAVALNLFKNTGSYSLSSLTFVVSGIHSIDIGVIHRPEALTDINGVRIGTRNHRHSVTADKPPFFLKAL